MIRRLLPSDFDDILTVVNDAARAYKGVIPTDCWKEPYMPAEEARQEVEDEVEFCGWTENGLLVGVMGIQQVRDVTLIRHAYVLTSRQREGIGEKLLSHLLSLARTPVILVGTWETAWWAVRFYEKHGFRLVSKEEKNRLLREYWNIPARQVETSVVLKLLIHSRVETDDSTI
ncbi:MAG TPA: GNAT family N-acetyltransferase [Candidatus Bathyarchaeia archaeon]|nr:GNAT family N-acetyltransferase [Candidatus Bathyarchaeia archaeon]